MELETARELAQERVAHMKRLESLGKHAVAESIEELSSRELFASLGRRIEALPSFIENTDDKGGYAKVLFEGKTPEEPPFIGLVLSTDYVSFRGNEMELSRIRARWQMLDDEDVAYGGIGSNIIEDEDVVMGQAEADSEWAKQRLALINQSVAEAEHALVVA